MLTFLSVMFGEKGSGRRSFHTFQELEEIPGFVHAITSRRSDESENTSKDAFSPRQVASARAGVLEALNLEPQELLLLQQVHSTEIVQDAVCQYQKEGDLPEADGILLLETDRFGVIQTADCLPLILVAPQDHTCCLLHAGWRGTRSHIAQRGVEAITGACGAAPDSLVAAFGPCIRSCCYEVGPEVRRDFAREGHSLERVFVGTHLDLVEANRADLERAGVCRVLDSRLCTSCHKDLFYSYRALKDTGRMWTVAGFRA